MSPDPLDPSRRYFLGQCTGLSIGAMALSTLVGRALAADGPSKLGLPNLPHFAAKAKRVIFLTQSGGPSQIELFDEKPGLTALAGTDRSRHAESPRVKRAAPPSAHSFPAASTAPRYRRAAGSSASPCRADLITSAGYVMSQ